MRSIVLILITCAISLPSAEWVVFSADGIGESTGGTTQATFERKTMDGVKQGHNAYYEMAFTGTEWSGKILNWNGFSEKAQAVDIREWPVLVIRAAGAVKANNVDLTIALQVKGGGQTEFLPLSQFDRQGKLLRQPTGWIDIEVPMASFFTAEQLQNGVGQGIWGVHFGIHSKANKDAQIWLKQIAFKR